MAGRPGFMLGINSPLVEINLNRRLSQTVISLASTNIVVTILWNDGYDEHGIIILDVVTTV